ncbi:MAG: hypothetical protein HYZ33_01005 [Ignavibacteriales bacterium]|nr:hypothetical protein [Ignavibacteriales bacterium]
MKFEQNLISRIFAIMTLAGISFGLYSTKSPVSAVTKSETNEPSYLQVNLNEIDVQVDSLLVKHGILLKAIRKKKIQAKESDFVRIERQVPTPTGLVSVLMTANFHAMAKRYNGRAIASENLKENTVTIHIEAGKNIVQSLILRPAPWVYETKVKDAKKSIKTKRTIKKKIKG